MEFKELISKRLSGVESVLGEDHAEEGFQEAIKILKGMLNAMGITNETLEDATKVPNKSIEKVKEAIKANQELMKKKLEGLRDNVHGMEGGRGHGMVMEPKPESVLEEEMEE